MEPVVEITSENTPLKVDFIPSIKGIIDERLLGLTHAPGTPTNKALNIIELE